MTADKYVSRIRQSEFSAQKLLQEEFCSPGWIAASHVIRSDALGRKLVCRKVGAYPVKGMVKCSDCGRWAPADTADVLCVDCRAVAANEALLARICRWPREDRVFLLQTSWRRPQPLRDWFEEGMPAPSGVMDFDRSAYDDGMADDSPLEQADLYDGHLERDQTWGNESSFHESLQRLRDSFVKECTTKSGEKKLRLRRHFLHQRIMLPESAATLRKEIAYYQRTGRIAPRARRINNPFDKSEIPIAMPGLPFELESSVVGRF